MKQLYPSVDGSADKNVHPTDSQAGTPAPPRNVGAPRSQAETPALLGLSFRKAFLIILALAVLLRLFILLFLPLYPEQGILPGYNDEPLHLQYVRHMASEGNWPIWESSTDSLNYMTDAYVHPPLYYSITARVYQLSEHITEGGGLYGARLLSIILGLIAGLFIYHTALLYFRDSNIALGAFAAAMLMPNTILFTGIVTNDALLYCMAALAIHSLVQCRSGGKNILREIITGGFIAAAVWTKMSGLTLIPLAWFAANHESRNRDKWLTRVRVFIIAIMLIMPLLLRNISVYGQFVPGQRTPLAEEYWPQQAVGVSGGGIQHPMKATMTWLRLTAVPLMDVWGSLQEKILSVLWIIVWGAVFLYGSYLLLKRETVDYFLLSIVLLVLIGFIWHNIRLYQVEFRLLMPAFPALAMITAKGADSLRIPVMIQVVIWCLPILLLPFL
ncbi:phospholipid carrier-dependent glycosyltransferase [bacterium]|nr:phospholipid carrier-dependent glycosyltransferase [bacterium]